jgi:hypothetical protein
MGNLLTHGLLAGAIMALVNVIIGIEPISWNVFLAAMISIILNLDHGGTRVAPGSPLCHSLGGGIFILYLAGALAFMAHAFLGLETSIAISLVMAIGAGILAHVLAEAANGEQVFTFPRNLRPETWLVKCDCDSQCFWPAWGRFSSGNRRLKEAHLNGISLAIILVSIGLFSGI